MEFRGVVVWAAQPAVPHVVRRRLLAPEPVGKRLVRALLSRFAAHLQVWRFFATIARSGKRSPNGVREQHAAHAVGQFERDEQLAARLLVQNERHGAGARTRLRVVRLLLVLLLCYSLRPPVRVSTPPFNFLSPTSMSEAQVRSLAGTVVRF